MASFDVKGTYELLIIPTYFYLNTFFLHFLFKFLHIYFFKLSNNILTRDPTSIRDEDNSLYSTILNFMNRFYGIKLDLKFT